MPTLNILCEAEALGPDYHPEYQYFSLNFAAGFSPPQGPDQVTAELVARYLAPWRWQWTLAVVGFAGATKIGALPFELVDWGLPDAPDQEQLRRPLEEHFDALLKNAGSGGDGSAAFQAGSFIWDPFDAQPEHLEPHPQERAPGARWFATLGQAWGYAQPIPLSSGVCTFFRLKHADLSHLGIDQVVMAPTFTSFGQSPVNTSPRQDGPQQLSAAGESGPFQWAYEHAPDNLEILAHQGPCPVSVADPAPGSAQSSTFLNRKTLRVEPTGAAAGVSPTENWVERLPALLADALNLPNLLVAGLRPRATNAGPATREQELTLPLDATTGGGLLAVLRDQAHAGAYVPPSGQSLASKWVEQLRPDLSADPPTLRALQAAVEQLLVRRAPNLVQWQGLLRAAGLAAEDLQLLTAETASAQDYPAAVDRIFAAVREQKTLEKLVLGQWELAFTGPNTSPDLAVFWAEAAEQGRALTRLLKQESLRQELALGTAGIAWRHLPRAGDKQNLVVEAIDTPEEVAQFLLDEIKLYWRARLLAPADASPEALDYEVLRPVVPAPVLLSTAFEEQVLRPAVNQLLDTFVATRSNKSSVYAVQAEDLVFQIDRVQQDAAEGSAEDLADPTSRVAGSILVFRDTAAAPAQPWGCANYAFAEVSHTSQGLLNDAGRLRLSPVPEGSVAALPPVPADTVSQLAPLVVPRSYGYGHGLRQATFAYQNQALVSLPAEQNPLHRLTQHVAFRTPVNLEYGGVADAARRPLLSYRNAYVAGSPVRLPALAYGRTYEAYVLVASTAGALPAEFTHSISVTTPAGQTVQERIPWALKYPLVWQGPDGSPAPPPAEPARQEREFRRRFPIGHLNVAAAGGIRTRSAQLAAPALPAQVSPLARVLLPDSPAMLVLLPGPSEGNRWLPEFKQRSNYRLTVFRPTVPVEIWRRWTNADPLVLGADPATQRDTRALVAWAATRSPVPRDESVEPEGAAAVSLTLDDPAVTSLYVTARRVWPVSSSSTAPLPPSQKIAFKFADNSAGEGLGRLQWSGLDVSVHPVLGGQPCRIISGGESSDVVVEVPEGEIWTVQLFPQVALGKENWFAEGMLTQECLPVDGGFELLVEVATLGPIQDASQVLHQALRVKEIAGQAAGSHALEVSLDPSLTPGAPGLFPWLHRVETLVQRWRWNGMPLKTMPLNDLDEASAGGFPFQVLRDAAAFDKPWRAELGPQLDALLAVEDATLFAKRDPEDYLAVPVAFSSLLGRPQQGGKPGSPVVVHTQQLGAFPGALYYRFAVRAYHRYEALMASNAGYDSRVPEAPTKTEQWRRHVRLCQFSGAVPPPVVRALLPLNARGATMLVVDEGAFQSQVAGLAEVIEGQITNVADPQSGAKLLQLGPDPILQIPVDPLLPQVPADGVQTMQGPVGFTFDFASSAPAFTRASYLWHPPKVRQGPRLLSLSELANYFVQVRFRRRIEPAGHVSPTQAAQLASPWTNSFWIRILAPIDEILTAKLHSPEMRALALTTSPTRLVFDSPRHCFRAKNEAQALVPLPSAPAYRADTKAVENAGRMAQALYLLLTQRIPDALGRPDEAFLFLELLDTAPDGALILPSELLARISPPRGATYPILRLVEVLYDLGPGRNSPPPGNAELLDKLIPAGEGTGGEIRATAMVMRITKPIDIV